MEVIPAYSGPITSSASNPSTFIHQLRANLAKHYYENTTRQLAKSNQNATFWCDLQEKIISFKAPKTKNLFVDQKQLTQAIDSHVNLERSFQYRKSTSTVTEECGESIFYLFKRNMWEINPEWNSFYLELKSLCINGLPPQYRITLWSELSRASFFVLLTKKLHYEYICQGSDDIYVKSHKIYEAIKNNSEECNIYLYQELEDDLEHLRQHTQVQKLPYENSIRNIARSFIFWTKLFNHSKAENNKRYYLVYSRALLSLCYGLVVCQASYKAEETSTIDEDQIFWILIGMAIHIMPTYFENGQTSSIVETILSNEEGLANFRRDNLDKSALNSAEIRGIKSDLYALKLLIKKNQIDLYNKFQEFGMPLEFYFAEHMLTLFIHLFNPGLTFRLWDVLFFEGSGFKVNLSF